MSSTHPIPDSYWVAQNSLLAGEYPASTTEARTRAKLGKLLAAGIRTFIDLTEETELEPYDRLLDDLASERGIECRHVRYGIRDLGVPEGLLLQQILQTIEEEIAAGRPVYVHCWGGIGRTGTVIGCWLVDEGLTGEAALARIAELRKRTPSGFSRSPETEAQRRYIIERAERRVLRT